MTVIIGETTLAEFNGDSTLCIISANWGFSPNIQRLFCLGDEGVPYALIYKPSENLSFTVYAPSNKTYELSGSEVCGSPDGDTSGTVTPMACGGELDAIAGTDWFVNSYNYSKEDSVMYGQETWGLIRWPAALPDTTEVTRPTYVSRGITEGQVTVDTVDDVAAENPAGIVFTDGSIVYVHTGSVSAGAMGKADILVTGTVTSFGNGSSVAGVTGTGSVSIPLTPLYI